MNPHHANKKSFIALSAAENVMWSQRQGLTDKVSITTAKVGWVHQAASDKLNEMEKRWSAKPSNAAETPLPFPTKPITLSLSAGLSFSLISVLSLMWQMSRRCTSLHCCWFLLLLGPVREQSGGRATHFVYFILKPSAADTNGMDSFSCLEFKNKQKAVERYWKTLRNES